MGGPRREAPLPRHCWPLTVPSKLQIPSSKLQRNLKLQTPKVLAGGPACARLGAAGAPDLFLARRLLELAAWSFSGAWGLELGAYPFPVAAA